MVKGGIQAYARHLVNALQLALGPENLEIFSKNDNLRERSDVAGSRWRTHGAWPLRVRTPAFSLRVLCGGLKRRPDLVVLTHLNFSPVAYWLTRLSGAPYWCVAHGVEAWGLKGSARVRGLRGAECVLAVSSYTRERLLREQRLNPEQVGVLPNTFRADDFRPGPKPDYLLNRHGFNSENRIILTVARLAAAEKYKGYDQVLRALPQIRRMVPGARYVLVGDGDDRGRVEHLIASLDLGRFVTMAGIVPDHELNDYYNLCDVFAMPSKGEGFGIVYLEALACGKPVLAGNGDGSSDPLLHGQLGVLVDPDSVPLLAESLSRILLGTYPLPVLYKPEALRERIIAAYGLDRFNSQVRTLLETFHKNRSGSRTCAPRQLAHSGHSLI
jgi:glycosyltransferase involved in cell wall biosynthesis